MRRLLWCGWLAAAFASAQAPVGPAGFGNPEPTIPPQCYTKTAGTANPCWACHTTRNGENDKADWGLQEVYAFSPAGNRNHWHNLFADRQRDIAQISDAEVLAHIRADNYTPLRRQAKSFTQGYQPDLDYARGFDAEGFARDGSGWRAFRYKPFPGVFWPTNGATDDVLIRLPAIYRQDAQGRDSRAIAQLNLAILEAALTVADTVPDARLARRIEPVSEVLAGLDLDGDGKLATATRIAGLPKTYAGAASGEPVNRWRYPQGTEFIHGVRYVDPDAPGLLSTRLKELRYSRKQLAPDRSGLIAAYRADNEEKLAGRVPVFKGSAEAGLMNSFGWVYQGWIEDAQGALRPQTLEETYACMGCHGGLGITVDSSFSFPRKVPAAAGWAYQSIAGIADVPMAGHRDGEVLTWFRRTQGGDEFRNNRELLARFFPKGRLDEAALRRAAPGGDRDLLWLLAPSRERALTLDKAYLALVRRQGFAAGRDVVLTPPHNVHREIRNGDTALRARGRVYSDGRLWLDWPEDR